MAGFQGGEFQENQPQRPSAYQVSTYIMGVMVPLAKANHMAKPRVTVGRDDTKARVQGSMVHWSPPKRQSSTGRHLAISAKESFDHMLKFVNVYFSANVALNTLQALTLKIFTTLWGRYWGRGKIKFPSTFLNSSGWTNNLITM